MVSFIGWWTLLTFIVFVIVLKLVVGKLVKDISWWQAFLIAVILIIVMTLISAFVSPLFTLGG